MARYYDIDELAAMIQAKADTLIEGKEAFLYVAKWLDLLPTADVVPKRTLELSQHLLKDAWKRIEELDEFYGNILNTIFEELEKKACSINRIMNQGEPVEWDMLPAVLIKRSDFEELKKKYVHNNHTVPPEIDVNH